MNNKKFIPSAQQTAVFDWILEDTGSLELMARAGCGKTTTLMGAVDIITNNGMGDIAIMAYNKSIADELKAKLVGMGVDWKQAEAGTCHSFGFRAWRKLAPNVQIDNYKVKTIIETHFNPIKDVPCVYRDNAETIAKMVSLAKQRAVGHLSAIEDTLGWYDIISHFGLDDEFTEETDEEAVVEAAILVYRESIRKCKEVIDFDDMILAPLYFKCRFWPKDWIMVDESQDTNLARRALALAMLKPRTGRMIFVGDDKQAIYGFTGADSNSMAQLKAATNAKTLPLTVTRRCPKAVVEQAQSLVPDIQAHDDAPQGAVRYLKYEEILAQNLSIDDVILCRNTAPLIETAFMLIAKGIGCKVEGREIGKGLIQLARRWKIDNLSDYLTKLDDHLERQKAKFMSKNQEYRIAALEDQIECIRVVVNRCLVKGVRTIDGLVKEIEDLFGDTKAGEPRKVLTLSTVHRSKGREWGRVFLLGAEKYMPSPYAKKPWQIEQEKNLEYVAYTRAMSELVFVSAKKKKD